MAKYQPQDTVTRVEVQQMLKKVAMKKRDDPATLFEQICSIKNRYSKTRIDEGDLIAVVLDAAPKEYQSVLTYEQRFRGNNLKLSDLESAMNQHWRQMEHMSNNNKTMIMN